jgi:RNA polymerase sigma-70 factor, ECF subfamily
VEATDFSQTLDAARRGDEAAFVALFRSVQPGLLRYLGAVGGPLADDVAADTWVSVVQSLHRFSGDEQGWQAWVFTIARARLRDEQRRMWRRPVPFDVEAALAEREGDCDVAADTERLLSTAAAVALIGQLPRDQAEIVLLRHVVGLDVAHTARVVGKRPGTVRVTAHRGLRRLAELLQDSAEPDGDPTPVTLLAARTIGG